MLEGLLQPQHLLIILAVALFVFGPKKLPELGKVAPYGVYDMAGNVWEWMNDWYDAKYYEKSPAKNPPGPESGTKRVIRGAGWQNETPTVRIFTRVDSDPTIRNESTGFRCAMDVPK